MLRLACPSLPCLLALLASALSVPAQPPEWKPIKDEVYLQEVGYQIRTESPVLSVAAFEGQVYAGFSDGIRRLNGTESLEPLAGSPEGPILRMKCAGNALWVMSGNGLHRYAGGAWTALADGDFVDVCEHLGMVLAATKHAVRRVEGDALAPWLPETPGPLLAMASHAETFYGLLSDHLFTYDGQKIEEEQVIELGKLPEKELHGLMSFGSRLLVSSHHGLGVIRGTAATQILGANGLPWEELECLAKGFAGDYWIGTPKGAIRAVDGEFQYFLGARWLPSDTVNGIACGPRSAYIATQAGLAIIDYEPYTLLKKAAYYERHLEEWGQKRGPFVHILFKHGANKGWQREVSDNDVGWSTHYWAAQAFKYGATKDEQARQNAVAGFNAMKWSEEVTGIPGFPARSVWAVGETGIKAQGGSGGYAAEWHPTADGLWEWKGDTSSDETDAQFYYAGIFYDLVANEQEKALVAEHVGRISSHILDHGWTLCDVDGQPTVWARWDPEYLRGKGRYAMGLNGMEALVYMRTTHALTGIDKYDAAVRQLVEMNYTEEVIRQKHVSPKWFLNHSDDRMAFYCYYTVLKYEKDPALRSMYLQSLERSFEIERIEQVPWFNLIYGARTGHDCELAQAAKHLREWPLDLVVYGYDMTGRRDMATPQGYIPYTDVERPISPRERNAMRWSHAAPKLKGVGGGGAVEDPSGWLDAYWMARYHGMILPPETTDPALTSVPERGLQLGATPYDGPPMPNVLAD